jgi:hypothetical protein
VTVGGKGEGRGVEDGKGDLMDVVSQELSRIETRNNTPI